MHGHEKQDENVLVHWTYTRDEWKRYLRWKKWKKGPLHYILHYLNPAGQHPAPEIKITPERVWIGDTHQHFNNDDHQIKNVDVRDEGRLNILEITYEKINSKKTGFDEIRIPVPKGKIREAIEVQERLFRM